MGQRIRAARSRIAITLPHYVAKRKLSKKAKVLIDSNSMFLLSPRVMEGGS